MSPVRPALTETVLAMVRYPTRDRGGDTELADALRMTVEFHTAGEINADVAGHYGACTGCGEPWPCGVCGMAYRAALEWMVGASAEVIAHSREVMRRVDAGEPVGSCVGCSLGWYGHGEQCPRWPGVGGGSRG